MTGMVRGWLQANVFIKGALLLIFIALFGTIIAPRQAAAGGPIMVARSFVQGKDEISGTTYNNPSGFPTNNTAPRTLRVYKGDTVKFYYYVQNWDPIPFIPGDVDVKYHTVDLTGKDTVMHEESRSFANIIPLLPAGYWYDMGSASSGSYKVISDKVTIDGTGADTPGKQYCAYVETNPTVYDYLDPTTLLVGLAQSTGLSYGVAVGDHKFASHSDALPIPLGLFAAAKINIYAIPLGNVMSCAEIAYNYDLTPSLAVNDPTDDGGFNVTSTMQNNSLQSAPATVPNTYTQLTQWKVTQFFDTQAHVNAKGLGLVTTPAVKNEATPCAYLQKILGTAIIPNKTTCAVPAQSNGQDTVFSRHGIVDLSLSKSGAINLPSLLPSPGVAPAGLQVCYMLSVNTYQPYQSNPHWRNSAVQCKDDDVLVRPTTQILGDDLHVGGDILTSQPDLSNAIASWAQYAAFAGGTSKCFATASSAASIKTAGATQDTLNTLTFANTITGSTCPSSYGNFTTASSLLGGAVSLHDRLAGLTSSKTISGNTAAAAADISSASAFPASDTTPHLSTNSATALYLKATNLIAKKTTAIIVSRVPVTLTSNIIYASDSNSGVAPPNNPANKLASPADIPQVIIVAPSITINKDVTQVDAWLVTDITTDPSSADATTHYINTCNVAAVPVPSNLTTGLGCDKPLLINGPVMTSHLYLNRTTDPATSPAETFNNRGDAYLWALNYANTNPTLTTTLQRELPPRF